MNGILGAPARKTGIRVSSAWLRPTVFLAALTPLAYTAWFLLLSGKTVEPNFFMINQAGTAAMVFLCLGLAVTPLRKLLSWAPLGQLRGMLGLFSFFYLCLHVLLVTWLEHEFEFAQVWAHVIRTPANLMDTLAFILLVPLAVTSNRYAKRRLGGAQWKRLHSLVYLIVPLAAARFWAGALTSGRWSETIVYYAIIAGLLGVRLYWK